MLSIFFINIGQFTNNIHLQQERKVIEIILSGGLGNQLFQYAYGRFLSEKHNEKLLLNTYRLDMNVKEETQRFLELKNLNLNADFINEPRLLGKNKYLDKLIKWNFFPNYAFEKLDHKKKIHYGHWLNRYYADQVRHKLLRELTFKNLICENFKKYLQITSEKKILSVHVRRGDYLTNLNASNFHGVLSKDFIDRAVMKAMSLKKFDDVWIFSDDLEWCNKNFTSYLTIDSVSQSPVSELLLMSKCDSHIISNSTFSWWGSWLNQNPDRLIIAPENWFKMKKNPPIYDKNWVLVKN